MTSFKTVAYLLVTAVWNSICGLKLTYANPPKSFEQVGQKTRAPQIVLSQGLATCLDSTLLFAAAIEAVGLNPIVVMTDGHCFAGAWLIERTLNQVVESDSSEIRKALAGNELITFETTLVTHSPPASFEEARRSAKAATQEAKENEFVAAIDIQRARMSQIAPLASHAKQSSDGSSGSIADEQIQFLPLSLPPGLSQLPAQLVEEKPSTTSGRIDRWQRKLLDLTLRNRLLNFRSTQQSIPVLCDDIAQLEDLLSADKRLKLISLPDQNPIGERDPELHRKKTNRDLDVQFASQALARKEVCCVLPTDQLDKRLTTIYRAVRNDLAEGGSNTLYLAVGFLRWRQKTSDKKTYRAPLLLIPIKLTRKSSHSPFCLRMHEDETRFNATLIQLLKQDFGKDLSNFESALPTDESGVDVPMILSQVRGHVRDIAGFEVVDECALGRFSFAKYLLWRDLVDRADQLKNNRVVKHLLDNPDKEFDCGDGVMPQPTKIDHYHPSEIYHPLDADSSQLAAVMAVAAGKDLVLIGPPGTGKSQTIANMIAQCLATKKTVLFVAEKTAALEVVHRRLRQHGLGDCCVELHSNKAERKKFLLQLEQNWKNNRRVKDNDWVVISERLKVRRDELNHYVAAVHAVQPNGWTAFQAFGISAHSTELPKPQFEWPDTVCHDKGAYETLFSAAKQLGLSFEAIGDTQTRLAIGAKDWSMKWENELLGAAEALRASSRELEFALKAFSRSTGLPKLVDASIAQLDELKRLAQALRESSDEDMRILFHKQFARFPAASQELSSAINAIVDARNALIADYGGSLDEIPVDEIDLQWREANAKFWPLSWFAKRKVQRLLQTYTVADEPTADPSSDLNSIRQIRIWQQSIVDNPLNKQSNRWNGFNTNVASLCKQLQLAKKLRTAIRQAGVTHNATNEISKAIHPFINGKSSDADLFKLATDYLEKLAAFHSSVKEFSKLAGDMPMGKQTVDVCAVTQIAATEILENRTFLKRWTMWCRAKCTANTLGLAPLVAELDLKQAYGE